MSFQPERKTFRIVNPDTRTFKFISGRVGIPEDDMVFSLEATSVGDEYHTLHDLYEHRMALNVALFNLLGRMDKQIGVRTVVKSLLHKDGTMFEGGYFIVMYTPKQISYHYHLKHWDKFQIPEVERIPVEYDGHTAHDVIERLLQL
jgi:hypothetical protein